MPAMDQSLLNGGVEWTSCVMGFTLAGLQWGDSSAQQTALCLHGWMDNAMSFSALAPHVADLGYRVVAIDMPGHGRSQHLPAFCGNYTAECYIRICTALLDQPEFPPRVLLIGHSMGAGIAQMLATVLPNRIEQLVLIEGIGLKTDMKRGSSAVAMLRKHCADSQVLSHKTARKYASMDALLQRLQTSHTGNLSLMDAMRLAYRGAVVDADATARFVHDLKLQCGNAFPASEEHVLDALRHLQCPLLLVLGTKGWRFDPQVMSARFEAIKCDVSIVTLEGYHHIHLSDAPAVAAVLQEFLQRQQPSLTNTTRSASRNLSKL